MRKPVWITVIAVTFIVGAIAWLIARRCGAPGTGRSGRPCAARTLLLPGSAATPPTRFCAAEALARHPATRSKNTPERALPIGPDDDHEFLRELAERIRGEQ